MGGGGGVPILLSAQHDDKSIDSEWGRRGGEW